MLSIDDVEQPGKNMVNTYLKIWSQITQTMVTHIKQNMIHNINNRFVKTHRMCGVCVQPLLMRIYMENQQKAQVRCLNAVNLNEIRGLRFSRGRPSMHFYGENGIRDIEQCKFKGQGYPWYRTQ
jgi:hypothetical protein